MRDLWLPPRDTTAELRRARAARALRQASAEARTIVEAAAAMTPEDVALEARLRVSRSLPRRPGGRGAPTAPEAAAPPSPVGRHLRDARRSIAELLQCCNAGKQPPQGAAAPAAAAEADTRAAALAELAGMYRTAPRGSLAEAAIADCAQFRAQADAAADVLPRPAAAQARGHGAAPPIREAALAVREQAVERRERALGEERETIREDEERIQGAEARVERRERRLEELLQELLTAQRARSPQRPEQPPAALGFPPAAAAAAAPAVPPPVRVATPEGTEDSSSAATREGPHLADEAADQRQDALSGDSSEDEWLLSEIVRHAHSGPKGAAEDALVAVLRRMAARSQGAAGDQAALAAERIAARRERRRRRGGQQQQQGPDAPPPPGMDPAAWVQVMAGTAPSWQRAGAAAPPPSAGGSPAREL
eukprot:TRINITY_DN12490_c0_g1_i1.p1 TRINITY_DN12490_c0_g1~~TRINITY_DN12490_c0_g1_i1.p1  ORF type:complete len:455 (+),score=142.81 TRINITY_DN12490_c0_g1_i1:97-1365(+)